MVHRTQLVTPTRRESALLGPDCYIGLWRGWSGITNKHQRQAVEEKGLQMCKVVD